jgi:hypothetical protein
MSIECAGAQRLSLFFRQQSFEFVARLSPRIRATREGSVENFGVAPAGIMRKDALLITGERACRTIFSLKLLKQFDGGNIVCEPASSLSEKPLLESRAVLNSRYDKKI